MNVHALQAVPRLTTLHHGPLQELERRLLADLVRIESWFRSQWQRTPPPFYASVDLRNAGFKLAPVDTNLFPAGFNNLGPELLPLAVQAVQAALGPRHPQACEILLIPENHTRNLPYFENVATLVQIFTQAGYRVTVGSLRPDLAAAETLELPSGRRLELHPVVREGDLLGTAGRRPCLIVLNNDLAGGVPPILEGLAQPVLPPVHAGWAMRLKSRHFAVYRDTAAELAALVGIDPWLIDPLSRNCGCIDFMKREGYECLEQHVGELLAEIGAKYAEYGIDKPPFVFIKADAGSYGMGVMAVRSVEEVRQLNRRQRTRMAATKDGRKVHRVIIQEGVYTSEAVDGKPAEPVVYLVDRYVVGGFYRVHTAKTDADNLNAPGMHFEPLAFERGCNTPDPSCAPDAAPNRFYAYGVVARLAVLAAARELAEGAPPAEAP
ncbi:MAG: glutamate--cysteine ligase [Gammaproteobacteria bacterium]|nr:MAG: glutamate--cysteine ligase [Gammaproteobacteria bacterium]